MVDTNVLLEARGFDRTGSSKQERCVSEIKNLQPFRKFKEMYIPDKYSTKIQKLEMVVVLEGEEAEEASAVRAGGA